MLIAMRLMRLSLGALTLLLLVVLPVNAAPALHTGSQTSYDLSISISFGQSCEPIASSTSSAGIVCPLVAMISPSLNINGILGWTVTDLNATTANLNVTRDLTIMSGENIPSAIPHIGSFNESINMATRIATILPFIEPEIDQAIQMAQANVGTSLATGADWSSIMSGIDVTMIRQPLHTMWWVNGPLKVNDTVPVLVFPTNVTGSTSLDLGGSIGTRSAWTLEFPETGSLLPPDPMATTTSATPITSNLGIMLTFNYDQTSDLLLAASADVHLGFGEVTFLPPTSCDSSATMGSALTVCPVTPTPIMREFGIDIQASLKLISTTLHLSQQLTPTSGSESSSGSSFGTGSGTDSGSGSGSHNPTTGGGQPANYVQSKPVAQSAGLLPWIYGILGAIAAAIIGFAVLIARRRMKKGSSQVAN